MEEGEQCLLFLTLWHLSCRFRKMDLGTSKIFRSGGLSIFTHREF